MSIVPLQMAIFISQQRSARAVGSGLLGPVAVTFCVVDWVTVVGSRMLVMTVSVAVDSKVVDEVAVVRDVVEMVVENVVRSVVGVVVVIVAVCVSITVML